MNSYILLTVILIVLCCFLIYKVQLKYNFFNENKCVFCVLCLLASTTIIIMACKINIAKDVIIFEATYESGINESDSDIAIECIKNDGIKYNIIDIQEGKWFYAGDNYVWQSESRLNNGNRQSILKNITDSVCIRTPIALSRYIIFADDSQGLVNVQVNNKHYSVDTSIDKVFKVEGTNLIKYFCVLLVKCLVILALCYLVQNIIATFLLKYPTGEMKTFWLVTTGMVLLIILYLYIYRDSYYLSGDGLFQLGYSLSPQNAINIARHSFTDPVVYSLLAWVWYSITPHGFNILMLLSQTATIIAVIVFGYAVSKYVNPRIGYISLCLLFIHPYVISQCMFENRYFGVWLLTVVLLYISYERRMNDERVRYIIFFQAMILISTITNYLSIIIVGIMFLYDLYLTVKKQLKLKQFIKSYLLEMIAGVPIFIIVLYKLLTVGIVWPALTGEDKGPDILNHLICYFAPGNSLWLLILGLGVAVIVFQNNKKVNPLLRGYVLIPIGYYIILTWYGVCLSQSSRVAYNRYYFCVFPIVIAIMATGLDYLISFMKSQEHKRIAMCATMIMLIVPSWTIVENSNEVVDSHYFYYQDSADWLMKRYKDIYREETLVLFDGNRYAADAWNDFCLKKKGLRDPVNFMCRDDVKDIETLLKFKTIYVYSSSNYSELIDMLEECYELKYDREAYHIKQYERLD